MGMLAEYGTVKMADSLFGGPSSPPPTLDDLLNAVGSDFTVNYLRQKAEEDRIRGAMSLPGNSVKTPV